MTHLNETHDPSLQSWVAAANAPDNGFPIQNLPFGVFRPRNDGLLRPGVAIGDQILDLAALAERHSWTGLAAEALDACQGDSLNNLMALGQAHWSALRLALSRALRSGSPLQSTLEPLLTPMNQAELALPARIGDYTDFYVSLHHATTVGKQFRPDNPLLPNYKWVPIGYHGRASSIGVAQQFPRPKGQIRPQAEGGEPGFGPSQRLDYELELGVFIGTGNAQGEPIAIDDAEKHVFGLCILNDWSARDLQAWEYQPLGPFLAKNFASTISPWIVTLEALAPFRVPFTRGQGEPAPLPYLQAKNAAEAAFDIELDVYLSTEQSRAKQAEPAHVSSSNFKDAAYWTVAQMVAHHTVNGCNLSAGDMLGTGTLSGPAAGQEGSLLESTAGGKQPLTLPWGEQRMFLQDNDEIILRAHARKPGYPTISLGEARGRVLPARG
ncbi:fumarylacetoacetase [Pusillimonas sp. TS35]|nr:fumarylacetoacetase [Pusillimonas sp. TS35]